MQFGEAEVPVQVHRIELELAVRILFVARQDGVVVDGVRRLERIGVSRAGGRTGRAALRAIAVIVPDRQLVSGRGGVGNAQRGQAHATAAMGQLVLLGVGQRQAHVVADLPEQRHAPAVDFLPVVVLVHVLVRVRLGHPGAVAVVDVPGRIGDAVGVALLVQPRHRGAQCNALAQRDVGHHVGVIAQAAVPGLVEAGVDLELALVQARLVGNVAHGATQAAAAVQSALRTEQGFDAGDVLDAVAHEGQGGVIQVVSERRTDELLDVVGSDGRHVQAAHGDRIGEACAVARRADAHAFGQQALGVGDVLGAQRFFGQGRHVVGHFRCQFGALGRRHDDLGDLVIARFELRFLARWRSLLLRERQRCVGGQQGGRDGGSKGALFGMHESGSPGVCVCVLCSW